MMRAILVLFLCFCALFGGDHSTLKNLKNRSSAQVYDPMCRDDILGFWLSPKDERTGRSNIVEIIKKDGQYFAYNVAFLDALDGGKDENNQIYALRDRDVLGSVFIYNLEKNTRHSYINGRYYDFNMGKIFHLRAKLECNNLALVISVDNVGMLGHKKIYKYLNPQDAEFYIRAKPVVDFSGVN